MNYALTLTWGSEVGSVYTLESSSDLVSWQTVQGGITGAGTATTFIVPPPAPGETNLFLRVSTNQ